MLKLTVKPGEYFTIGDDIKVIVSGGSANNIHILVDAPKKYMILRSPVIERNATANGNGKPIKKYYKEPGLSEEAQNQIREIILRDKAQSASIDSP